jgi:hypothetical protein
MVLAALSHGGFAIIWAAAVGAIFGAAHTGGGSALASGNACFLGGEFVRRTFFVSGLSPFAGDLTLLVGIH